MTILDDDKPGMFVFEEKKTLRHPATDSQCKVIINRINGTDGEVSVKYKTVTLGKGDQSAKKDEDYIHTEGVLKFDHQESMKEIVIEMIKKDDLKERGEIFGLKLYDAVPAACKISKKDT